MAANVCDKFELENFRPTVANKSEPEVYLCIFPIDKHVLYSFHLGFSSDKVKLWRN